MKARGEGVCGAWGDVGEVDEVREGVCGDGSGFWAVSAEMGG